MTCKGNATEYCGGSNRLNVYQFGTVSSTSSTSQSSTSPSTASPSSTAQSAKTSATSNIAASSSISPTSTSSSAGASSTATGLPSGWSYKGCYVDNANGRILLNGQPGSATQTIEKCVTACQAAGYSVAGLEYAK